MKLLSIYIFIVPFLPYPEVQIFPSALVKSPFLTDRNQVSVPYVFLNILV
jgi:hypothetical protein